MWGHQPIVQECFIYLRVSPPVDKILDFGWWGHQPIVQKILPEDYRFSSARFYKEGIDEFGILTHFKDEISVGGDTNR